MQLDVNGKPRALMPDYLRLIALFGIVLVNVQNLAFPIFPPMAVSAGVTVLDGIVVWLINGLALLKSYNLFAFMFGVGLGLMIVSAERRGLPFGKLYRNRMIGLLLLGIAHGCLFYYADILVSYAIIGSIFYFLRNWPVRRLVVLGGALLILQVIVAVPMAINLNTHSEDLLLRERLSIADGSFLEAVAFRSWLFDICVISGLKFQGISGLGWFCFGLAAVRSGMIENVEHPLWSFARRWCLVPGLVLSLISAAMWQWGPAQLGVALTLLFTPLLTVGYLGLIAALAHSPGPMMSKALNAGGSSLSIYLGQSIVLSTIFSGYGFGLWNEVDRLTVAAIAILVTIALIIFVSIWKTRFALGPFEWVLRYITYAGKSRRGS